MIYEEVLLTDFAKGKDKENLTGIKIFDDKNERIGYITEINNKELHFITKNKQNFKTDINYVYVLEDKAGNEIGAVPLPFAKGGSIDNKLEEIYIKHFLNGLSTYIDTRNRSEFNKWKKNRLKKLGNLASSQDIYTLKNGKMVSEEEFTKSHYNFAKGGNVESTKTQLAKKHETVICEKVPEDFKKVFAKIKAITKDFTIKADKEIIEQYNIVYDLLAKKVPEAIKSEQTNITDEKEQLKQALDDLKVLYSIAETDEKKALKQDLNDLKLLIKLL